MAALSLINSQIRNRLTALGRGPCPEIYRRKSYSQELGLSFRGRSRILTINYRNTEQIVQFAWDMYEHFNPTKRSERSEGIVEIIPPQSTRRKGPAPFVKKTSSFHDEARSIASEIKRLHYIENIDYSQIAVFYRVKQMSIPYVKILINTFKNKEFLTIGFRRISRVKECLTAMKAQ